MGQLDGKTAIVTGASSGIGEAIAAAFAAEGAKVALAARRADRLEALAVRIGHGAIAVRADVTKEPDVLALFERTKAAFGRVDILVNNAGIARHKPTDETTLAEWQEVIDINLTAAFLCAREALKAMKPQKSGRIINIGSVSARRPRLHTIGYAASKFGLEGMTHSIAMEGREHGITCSILHPGVTESNLAGDTTTKASDKIMPVVEVAKIVTLMAALPRDMSFLDATVLPIGMPFLARA
ncbi:MAG TPA: SDR family oxidoreductase [Hyphomicrobiales bacterium]|nr:SDR family oxidoreductase [Hyphomicrobiales bacterium]